MEGEEPISQPHDFKFCPLGLQFYSPRALGECNLMDFSLQVTGDSGEKRNITCSGIVAHCRKEPDGSMYRIWLNFIDLPDEAKKHIQCLACTSDFLCPYCENY